MDNVFQLNNAFNFDLLELKHPTGLQGGGYFTRLNIEDKPLYLQLNRCKTKNGIIKTNKKQYLDLLFDNTDEKTISWFEALQNKCQNIIYEKRNLWFHNDLEFDDIESNFVSPLRIFKSGKHYLVRCKIPIIESNISSLNCYDINNNPLDNNHLNDTSQWIIPLIEVQGIRFTSRDFSFEFVVKQVMVIDSLDFNKQCMIKQQSLGNNSNLIKNDEKILFNNEIHMKTNEKNVVQLTNKDIEVNKDMLVEENIDLQDPREVLDEQDEPSTLEEEQEQEQDESSTLEEEEQEQDESSTLEEEEKENDVRNYLENISKENVYQSDINNELKQNSDIDKPELHTLDINFEDLGNDIVKLKKREEVYYDIWYEARNRAKLAREEAIKAYLEAKQIKNYYMIDECSDIESDDENEEFSLEK